MKKILNELVERELREFKPEELKILYMECGNFPTIRAKCNEELSFAICDTRGVLHGVFLLTSKDIPATITFPQPEEEAPSIRRNLQKEDIDYRGKGCEILYIRIPQNIQDLYLESFMLKHLYSRIANCCKDGKPVFDYIWSVSLNNWTSFVSDVFIGENTEVLLSESEKAEFFYCKIKREELYNP